MAHAMIFSFNENIFIVENAFPYKFLKLLKRSSFHRQIFLDLKSLWVVIYMKF